MSETGWPFDQPQNAAAITLRSIVLEGARILYVAHDADDHGWQFLDGGPVDPDDAAAVSMEEILRLDSTVGEVGDLPPGWIAWRESGQSELERSPRTET